MSKVFQPIGFDIAAFEKEVREFEHLLRKQWLSENNDILPFFKERKILSSQIATDIPGMLLPDRIAFEYDIFGDFVADLAIGNTESQTYCFVEFEDAKEFSLFDKRSSKFQPPFGKRLEQGHSQVIDWFCKLDSLRGSPHEFKSRFSSAEIDYHGILIIGRNSSLEKEDGNADALKYRLDWRSKNVRMMHKQIMILTYDGLLAKLKNELRIIQAFRQ